MAYTSGFEHDVFISYAVADNGGPYAKQPGWVQAFKEQLQTDLNREVNGKRSVDIWLDRDQLACGDAFDREICKGLQSTAVLVVLLSKQSLASPYCQLERETFLKAIAGQADRDGRVFVVQLTAPEKLAEAVPDDLARLQHEKMWESRDGKPRRIGHPLPVAGKVEYQSFYDKTYTIAEAIANRLDELDEAASSGDAAPATGSEPPQATPAPAGQQTKPASDGPAIYLAEVPRGTDTNRFAGELRTRLENAIPPVRVLPDGPLPKTEAEASEFIRAQLGRSQLYVHLVGWNVGSTPDGFSQPLLRLQQQLAEQADPPSLLWRLSDVVPDEMDDTGQRELAERALTGDVEACGRAISERLDELAREKTAAAQTTDRGSAAGKTLFVNHLPDDEPLARDVCRTLAGHRYVCVKRSFDGATEEELRLDFERSLTTCDSLLMVYGRAAKPAAKAQVLECLKVVGDGQAVDRSIGDWFVVVGPPLKHNASLDLYFDGLHEVDCSSDLEGPLVAALTDLRDGGVA